MRRWQRVTVILALLAFMLAAIRSGEGGGGALAVWLFGGWLASVRSTAFFWAGVALFLASVWGRGGT